MDRVSNGLPALLRRVQQPALRRDGKRTAKLSPLLAACSVAVKYHSFAGEGI